MEQNNGIIVRFSWQNLNALGNLKLQKEAPNPESEEFVVVPETQRSKLLLTAEAPPRRKSSESSSGNAVPRATLAPASTEQQNERRRKSQVDLAQQVEMKKKKKQAALLLRQVNLGQFYTLFTLLYFFCLLFHRQLLQKNNGILVRMADQDLNEL